MIAFSHSLVLSNELSLFKSLSVTIFLLTLLCRRPEKNVTDFSGNVLRALNRNTELEYNFNVFNFLQYSNSTTLLLTIIKVLLVDYHHCQQNCETHQ